MNRSTRLTLTAAALVCGLTAGTPPAVALPDWRTSATSYTNERAWMPSVVDVRHAEHRSFDRVVVDVRGRRPGYSIRHARVLRFDGSGQKAHLRGRHKMVLVLDPASGHDQAGNSVYRGPRHLRLQFATLRGIKLLGDYEGRVTLGLGLDRKAPYRIFTLTDPSRVVVDFRH